jgi:hypothetical protein
MELIDRYIHEVGRYLPRNTRGDIQTELRSLLLDSMEGDGGEEVSEDDVVAKLKEFGPPKEVAASYWPQDQYLIGPELYPLFRLVTAIVLAAVLGALLLAWGINIITSETPFIAPGITEAFTFILELFGSLLSAFGALVLTFAILQRFNVRPELDEEEWDPRSLPPVDEGEIINRTETVVGMAFALFILAILWFFPNIVSGIASWGQEIIINPVIQAYLPIISVSLLLSITLDLVVLRQGRWSQGTRLIKIGVNLFGIYVLYLLIAGHTSWLAANEAGGFFSSIESLAENVGAGTEALVMHAFRLAFFIALIVSVLETIGLIYKTIKRAVAPSPPVAPAGR